MPSSCFFDLAADRVDDSDFRAALKIPADQKVHAAFFYWACAHEDVKFNALAYAFMMGVRLFVAVGHCTSHNRDMDIIRNVERYIHGLLHTQTIVWFVMSGLEGSGGGDSLQAYFIDFKLNRPKNDQEKEVDAQRIRERPRTKRKHSEVNEGERPGGEEENRGEEKEREEKREEKSQSKRKKKKKPYWHGNLRERGRTPPLDAFRIFVALGVSLSCCVSGSLLWSDRSTTTHA